LNPPPEAAQEIVLEATFAAGEAITLPGGPGNERVADLVARPGGGYLAAITYDGMFLTVDLTLSTNGGEDALAYAMDDVLLPVQTRTFGDAENQSADAAAVDADNTPIYAGTFAGTIDLGFGPHTAQGPTDVWVARFQNGL